MEEIGARLQAQRKSRGISLEQAEEETKIRRKYIEALESGRRADLPGEVYLKGFLRTYGNYLGIDGAALVDEYKESIHPRRALNQSAATGEPSRGRRLAERREQIAARRRGAAGRPAGERAVAALFPWRNLVTTLMVAVAVGAIGYLGWLIALQFDASLDPQAANQLPPPPPVQSTPVPGPSTTPPPKVPDPPKVGMSRGQGEEVHFAVPAKEITVRLEFTSTEPLWMRSFVNGQQSWEGFPANYPQYRQSMEFKGASIRLRMGHMNGVNVVVNGQRFDKPLEKGPYTLIFTAQP